ncbi:MAG: xanthine dehydrogenase family protein molybdopterin-binding subunit, partial [Chloroflexota bacterium]
VTVSQPDTDVAPFNNPTGGSRITYSLGTAVHRAAVDARTKLKQRAAQQLKVPPDEVEYRQGKFWVRSDEENSLTLQQVARASIGSGEGPVIGTGEVTHLLRAPAFATQVVEAEVDQETGLAQVVKVTAAQDVGCAVNPTACEGQIQGGVVQGIGWALTEEYVYDDHGQLRNPSLLDYRMPTALDAPNIECVLVEVPAADGPYGVRGTGEVPIVPTPAAIAAAVYDAIGARVTELPVTGEKVLNALAASGSDGKARHAAATALTERPAFVGAAHARQSVLNAQRAPAAAGGVKLATESEDYCAEDDVAETPEGASTPDEGSRVLGGTLMAQADQGARGTPAQSPTPKVGEVKLATESEDYCAEDDVKET